MRRLIFFAQSTAQSKNYWRQRTCLWDAEQVVDQFIQLKDAVCDGTQVNFFYFAPDLEFFGERVMPLLTQAGLRYA